MAVSVRAGWSCGNAILPDGPAIVYLPHINRSSQEITETTGHKLTDATDGTSNTLLVGERPPSAALDLGWWYAGWGQGKNGDAEFLLGARSRCYNRHRATCDEGPYRFTTGAFANPCDAFHFWSPHPGGAHFAFADGSVRFLRYTADDVLPALATRAGGETVGVPD